MTDLANRRVGIFHGVLGWPVDWSETASHTVA